MLVSSDEAWTTGEQLVFGMTMPASYFLRLSLIFFGVRCLPSTKLLKSICPYFLHPKKLYGTITAFLYQGHFTVLCYQLNGDMLQQCSLNLFPLRHLPIAPIFLLFLMSLLCLSVPKGKHGEKVTQFPIKVSLYIKAIHYS